MGGMLHNIYRRKQLTPQQESEICMKCQFCCRWIAFKAPLGTQQHGYYEFLTSWGIPTSLLATELHMWIPLPCQHIREKEGCMIYEKRPTICKGFRGGDADPAMIPYCMWYEAIPDNEKSKVLKGIEWNDKPKVPGT